MINRKMHTSAKSRPSHAPRIVSPFEDATGKPALKNRLRKGAEAKYTIPDAFDFFSAPAGAGDDDDRAFESFHIERAIRAAGFLLHWSSQMGNDTLDGHIADGLGWLLDHTANQLNRVQAGYERDLTTLRHAHENAEGRK